MFFDDDMIAQDADAFKVNKVGAFGAYPRFMFDAVGCCCVIQLCGLIVVPLANLVVSVVTPVKQAGYGFLACTCG